MLSLECQPGSDPTPTAVAHWCVQGCGLGAFQHAIAACTASLGAVYGVGRALLHFWEAMSNAWLHASTGPKPGALPPAWEVRSSVCGRHLLEN